MLLRHNHENGQQTRPRRIFFLFLLVFIVSRRNPSAEFLEDVVASGGEEVEKEKRTPDIPRRRYHLQRWLHLHGCCRRLLPLLLADGGWGNSSFGSGRHLLPLRGRSGGDGVLGAMGAPLSLARIVVENARVSPPPKGRSLRAQRCLRLHQRRAGDSASLLWLLPHRPSLGPLLWRRSGDYPFRDGLHVRPRWPGAQKVSRGTHRPRPLLPARRCRPSAAPLREVRGCAIWAVPWSQGIEGRGRKRGFGKGDQEDEVEVHNGDTLMGIPSTLFFFPPFFSLPFESCGFKKSCASGSLALYLFHYFFGVVKIGERVPEFSRFRAARKQKQRQGN